MTTYIVDKGHNSPFKVRITDFDGTAYTAARMATITRVYAKYIYAAGQTAKYADSAETGHENVFDWTTLATTGDMIVDMGNLAFTAGRDPSVELVVYDSVYTAGRKVALLDIEVSDAILGPLTLVDPLQNISIGDLSDVDLTGGTTGDVLTQQPDGTFKPETPTGGTGGGEIDETLATNLSYSGIISTITVGETIAFGDHLYRSPANGLYYQAQANAILTVPVTRMALEAATIGEECLTLCPGGIVRNDAWDFTDDGSIIEIWLSAAVAGGMTESVDTTAGCFGQVVGTPLASNILEFRPSLPVARF